MDFIHKTQKILIADDDAEILEILSILLSGDGYDITTASNGDEVVSLADESFSLIVLDVNMPKLSGFLACSEIRKKTMAPILFLTARTQESDKAIGFSAGGDDYLSKPFSNAEFLMRVKALIRRYSQYGSIPTQQSNPILLVSDMVINTDEKTVSVDGVLIPLTSTEYDILELLALNRKKIFSMENIYSSIWNDSYIGASDNAIMVHIKNLRKKIEKNPKEPKYIKTAWGRGYYIG
ncbi:response regulator transcription factor [Clostridium butyricum]|uniref:Stage 0 sporulation protein A homolog n=2 Tax=Clostridium butyricum TaxID=1492 RepID=A0AAP9RCF4_CLOBU|nr:response regulator transcription factor [Clostridium butyricum]MBZ5745848.1 response regulator transcription factor [Clostridium butyricum]MCQ2012067.1 response regulator transcription factor [Clostridium butyricum]MCQ2024473.1 response regulator transcription factor [Clostridium butyricum]MDI9210631.1 response regulator transcription factor [Clostridium butyricum]MDU3582962.1 response regulator transcription factor [Clostridium butyricum]